MWRLWIFFFQLSYYYRLQGKIMFSQASVILPQSASWLLGHCSSLLLRVRYAFYWHAFLFLGRFWFDLVSSMFAWPVAKLSTYININVIKSFLYHVIISICGIDKYRRKVCLLSVIVNRPIHTKSTLRLLSRRQPSGIVALAFHFLRLCILSSLIRHFLIILTWLINLLLICNTCSNNIWLKFHQVAGPRCLKAQKAQTNCFA